MEDNKLIRLNWEDYFSTMALWIKSRSPDSSTKHAAIFVNKKNQILCLGFNGFPAGCLDHQMPQIRPEKYNVILHAEEAAILNANCSLENSTAFITGYPCVKCWRLLIQKGIKKVVYGPIKSKHINSDHLNDNKDNELINLMLAGHDIEIKEWKPNDLNLIKENLESILDTLKENYEITNVPF